MLWNNQIVKFENKLKLCCSDCRLWLDLNNLTRKMGRKDGKPKGKMSGYAFFVQTCREEHKKKHPGEPVVFAEFSRKCASKWKVRLLLACLLWLESSCWDGSPLLTQNSKNWAIHRQTAAWQNTKQGINSMYTVSYLSISACCRFLVSILNSKLFVKWYIFQ